MRPLQARGCPTPSWPRFVSVRSWPASGSVLAQRWPSTTGRGVLWWASRCASRARLGKAALVGFSAAALAFKPRDSWLGWSDDQHFRRLRYMTDNQRFCARPGLDSCRMRSAGSAFVRSVQRSFMRTQPPSGLAGIPATRWLLSMARPTSKGSPGSCDTYSGPRQGGSHPNWSYWLSAVERVPCR